MLTRFRRSVACGLALLLVGAAHAQTAVPVQMDLDYAAFAYDAETSLLELYMAFGAEQMTFVQDDSTDFYLATLPVDMMLVRSTDAQLPGTPEGPVWVDSLALNFMVMDTTLIMPGQRFVHQVRTAIAPGEYELRLTIPEASSRQRLELRRDIVLPDYAADARVALSDITLAASIEQGSDSASPFYKNGLIISPNTDQLFGQGLTRVFYYAEAYSVDAIADDEGTYTAFTYIAEANRPQPLGDLQSRETREARSPDVLVGAFNISALPSGSYFLRMALLNEDNEAVVEQSRKFFVYNPDVEREADVAAEASFETSPYAAMPEDEVTQALEHIDLIATDRERRRARSIRSLDEQRRFLMDFWQKRDPNPATAVNEFKNEFYNRLQYASDRYTTSFNEGWKTDRGRVLVKYGTPSTVEPHLFDRDTYPHELWQYNNIPGEGQALFVFADQEGFGRFELIHSTVAGERKEANWQSELRR